MKKILLVVILIMISLFSLSAAKYDKADGFGIGLSAGYPVAGAAFKIGKGDYRIVGTLGYSFVNNVAIEGGVQYDLDRFSIDKVPFYLNIGITGAANFNPAFDGFSINVPLGISYFLVDVPVEFFFKITPGLRVRSYAVVPDLGAALGVLFYLD